jgi:RNA polymerase sigma-70 factor (ECF subfamily)
LSDALSARFHQGLGQASAPADGLEHSLQERLEEARAAWPDVHVDEGDFAELLGGKAGSVEGLLELRSPDLYLACALEVGDSAAVRCLERMIRADLPAVLASSPGLRPHADDLLQALLERLLVPGEEHGSPRIAGYSGKGSLRGWVRVSLTRLALNFAARGPKERLAEDDDALLEVEGATVDPELAQMRRLYQADFKTVLRETLEGLTAHERNLLRHRYLDGLQVDGIAAIYGIHRVTAARQLAKARDGLQAGLRARVAARWNLSPSGAASLARLMRSELHLTLRGLFSPPPESGAS